MDIFTVGSDWIGKFDYLKEYCRVVYLERTEGVSSSEIRSEERKVRLGIIGDSHIAKSTFGKHNMSMGWKLLVCARKIRNISRRFLS